MEENDGVYMRVSENSGTPKSSILIGISIINHPSRGTTIFGNIHMDFLLTSPPGGLNSILMFPSFAPGPEVRSIVLDKQVKRGEIHAGHVVFQ